MGGRDGRGRGASRFRLRFRNRFRGRGRFRFRGRVRKRHGVRGRGNIRGPSPDNKRGGNSEMGRFVAHDLALELVCALGRVLPRITRKDKDLSRQLRRSAASVVLNLAEGANSDPGNRQARYANAAGSAKETQSALIVAEAWGYIADPRLLALADRLSAITYRLAHGHCYPKPKTASASEADPEPDPEPDPDPEPASEPDPDSPTS